MARQARGSDQQRARRLSFGGAEGGPVQRLASSIQETISKSPIAGLLNGRLTPRVDVEDAGGEIRVTAEVPGLDRERLDVTLLPTNVLRIKAIEAENADEAPASAEPRAGASKAFERWVRLRCNVEHSGAQATLRNGLLTVRLPKAKPVEASPHPIRVTAA